MPTQKRQKMIWGMVMFFPFGVGFLVFYILPFLLSVFYTFKQGKKFVLFANYIDVFTSKTFLLATKNTLAFLVIGVPLILIISCFMAVSIYNYFSENAVFQTIFLFPLVIPAAATVVVVKIFFDDNGITNHLLAALGLKQQAWMQSNWAFVILIGLYIWKNVGYNVVLILAGLNTVSKEAIEAAKIDGANEFQIFAKITFPLLRPTLFFTIVISIANFFKSFREAYLLGGDTPNASIYMLQHFLNNNFANANYARLSVASITLFVLIAAVITLIWNMIRRWEE